MSHRFDPPATSKTTGTSPTDELLSLVYDELRRVAARRLGQERPDHTLRPTELVHEAYVQLARNERIEWRDRAHFFGSAAETMRRILIDYARRRGRAKRGGGQRTIPIDLIDVAATGDPNEILALDHALTQMEAMDAQMAQVVKLRFYAGLTVGEVAELLGISASTVKRDWSVARAWLYQTLGGDDVDEAS